MKQPKPFHIGTRVRLNDQLETEPSMIVLMAWYETCNFPPRLAVAYTSDERGFAQWTSADDLAHADDGSPLGEWVPINPDAEVVHRWEDPETGEEVDLRTINVQDANAIIRGEVEQ